MNFVHAPDELELRVRDYAAGIAVNAPLTIQACKAGLKLFEHYSDHDGARVVNEQVDRCFDSADYREGRTAFMDKRQPRFTGR